MDKDEQKPVEKPKEEKPNTEIKPPEFDHQKHSYQGDTIKFIDKTENK